MTARSAPDGNTLVAASGAPYSNGPSRLRRGSIARAIWSTASEPSRVVPVPARYGAAEIVLPTTRAESFAKCWLIDPFTRPVTPVHTGHARRRGGARTLSWSGARRSSCGGQQEPGHFLRRSVPKPRTLEASASRAARVRLRSTFGRNVSAGSSIPLSPGRRCAVRMRCAASRVRRRQRRGVARDVRTAW